MKENKMIMTDITLCKFLMLNVFNVKISTVNIPESTNFSNFGVIN